MADLNSRSGHLEPLNDLVQMGLSPCVDKFLGVKIARISKRVEAHLDKLWCQWNSALDLNAVMPIFITRQSYHLRVILFHHTVCGPI